MFCISVTVIFLDKTRVIDLLAALVEWSHLILKNTIIFKFVYSLSASHVPVFTILCHAQISFSKDMYRG